MVTLLRLGHSWVREAVCAARGHDMMLHLEPERLSLLCVACGAETPGWRIDVNPRFARRPPARARRAPSAMRRPPTDNGTMASYHAVRDPA